MLFYCVLLTVVCVCVFRAGVSLYHEKGAEVESSF